MILRASLVLVRHASLILDYRARAQVIGTKATAAQMCAAGIPLSLALLALANRSI